MIKFEDFFKVDFSNVTKVKFNMNSDGVRAWDLLREDDSSEKYQEWISMNAWKSLSGQANNNLNNAKYLLAFAQYCSLGLEYFIFGGMYKVEQMDTSNATKDCVGYKLTLMDDYKEYRRRLVVKLGRVIGRDIYNKPYLTVQKDFNPEIYEIAPTMKSVEFTNYSDVLLKHSDLQAIFRGESREWKNALSRVKCVYCITDTKTGELYIGSASEDNEGIWGRWKRYANVNDLTGGNKAFEEMKKNGAGRIIDNFTYSILEIFDMRTDRKFIQNREEFWKRVFKSVEYGMNRVRDNKK